MTERPVRTEMPNQIELSVVNRFRREIWTKFLKGIKEYELIQAGDKIAVCISGGKDSMLMAMCMKRLQRYSKIPFEVVFLVMNPGYNEINYQKIRENAELLEIPVQVFETGIFDAVAKVDQHPCYLCARMRRGHLYKTARELGCNKIALGHHFDDVIETILMAMLWGGQLQGMMPKLRSRSHPGMEVIRPLYMVHEQNIIAWAEANGLSFIQCACRVTQKSGGSKRQEVKELLARLNLENDKVEKNVFNAIHTLQPDSFPGWRAHGVAHSFLEWYDGEERT